MSKEIAAMIRPLALVLAFLCGVAFAVPAQAANTTTFFPPNLFNTTRVPVATDGECALTYLEGQSSTYCRTQAQSFDFVIPDQSAAQNVFRRALPSCTKGQYLAYDGASYVCKSIPSCMTNQFLNFDAKSNDLACSPVVLPVCPDNKYLTSYDGVNFVCDGDAVCTPGGDTITGYGTCSATCGGGSQDVYHSDGCRTWTTQRACNTQACPVQCNGKVINGYCFYLGDAVQSGQWPKSCDEVCGAHGASCNLQGTQWAASSQAASGWSDNCGTVATAFGQQYRGAYTPVVLDPSVGCIAMPNTAVQYTNAYTVLGNVTCGVQQQPITILWRRYCACSN